jgi:predicted ATPase
MQFFVIKIGNSIPTNALSKTYLVEDKWDDWGKFRTQFRLIFVDAEGTQHNAGDVKIGQRGLKPGSDRVPGLRAPTLESSFDELSEDSFSIGQSETYYETLNTLPPEIRTEILVGLRDCAFDLTLFASVISEPVMVDSLLRGINSTNVENRLHRLACGDAVLTSYQFEYQYPAAQADYAHAPCLKFVVSPASIPPSNVHVLIGRNGVGKTTCMQGIAKSLLETTVGDTKVGELRPIGEKNDEWSFAGMIWISFSAFDDFDLPMAQKNGITAAAVGLRARIGETQDIATKTPAQLSDDFLKSFAICRKGLRANRWEDAVRTLENDPLFAEAEVTTLLQADDNIWETQAARLYKNLSSGHKIILLTITRLVELVDERTLVLLDEPESHLHPPLLSAFIRSLSDLLLKRNGVAIIATHSPVILQEVPATCVSLLRRTGAISVVESPTYETFGENVGVLTREVFGLEVTNTGFHALLKTAVTEDNLDYEGVLSRFEGQLGAEARAITRGLIASKDTGTSNA